MMFRIIVVAGLFGSLSHGLAVKFSGSNKKKASGRGGGGGFGTAKKNDNALTYTPDTASTTTQSLLSFLNSQNSQLEGTEIGLDAVTKLRGMYATKAFKKGDILCKIPSDCALALSDPALGGSDVPTVAHSGRNFIQRYQNDKQANQLWKPYLDTLPTRDSLFDPTPDFYADEEIEAMEFPRAISRARQRQEEVETLAKQEQISVDQLRFATWLVSSRSFSIQISVGDTDKNNNSAKTSTLQKSIRVLLPYLDMINHSSNQFNTELHLIDPEKDDAWFAIRATRPIALGKEVTLCYGSGADSSVELMGNYGFVPRTNPMDALMLRKEGESLDSWSTSLQEDLEALETATGNLRTVLALRIRLKQANEEMSKKN